MEANQPIVILGAVVIGVIGGAMGALFVNINFRVNAIRKRLLSASWMKPLETAIWAFVTSSAFFWTAFLMYYNDRANSCLPVPPN